MQSSVCRIAGQDWFVSSSDKEKIDKLLLERISLAGIRSMCNVEATWLQKNIKNLYEVSPDDLKADLVLAEIESYLSDRMGEEFHRF